MEKVKLACMAMATRFEIVLAGGDAGWLRAVGEEALREVKTLDAQLSYYRSSSDIGRLNAAAHKGAIPVDGRVFSLLSRAKELWETTAGAFDPTVGPLMKCWGLSGSRGRIPTDAEIRSAMDCTGMGLVELDDETRSVRYRRDGVEIDLGGIGKGFAIDEAMHLVREAGVEHALLHGGTSTVSTIGTAPDGSAWKVAIGNATADPPGSSGDLSAIAQLADESLSVSDIGGKRFEIDGVSYGHVIDPRSGAPARGPSLSAVSVKSAADADAF